MGRIGLVFVDLDAQAGPGRRVDPAVDVLDGKVVRLMEGDYARVTVYADDAVAQAREWCEAGATLVHVVDLAGARDGEPAEGLWRSLGEAGVAFQVGGGIRTAEAAERAIAVGAARVVMGTTAVWQPDLLAGAVATIGAERIVAALDVCLIPYRINRYTEALSPIKLHECLAMGRPVVTTDLPGSHFVLRASSLGSLNVGAPVYFRRIEVGQVVSYQLDEDGQAVTIQVFIHDPHHQLVRKNTRFWNASGLDVAIGADGIRVDTESFTTMMIGGIAFDTPANLEPGEPAEENEVFKLYENRDSISEKTYARKERWLLHFDGDVRGLKEGAPVELQGIQIGQVLDVNLEFDVDKAAFSIPVLVETEPDRIKAIGKIPEGAEQQKIMDYLVAKGMRAQLKTGSLITGQLLVAIDMHPEAPPAKINWEGRYPEFPTVPTAMEEITTSLTQLLNKFEKLPIEQIGNDLRDTIAGAKRLINSAELEGSITALNQTLNQAQMTINTGQTAAAILDAADQRLGERADSALHPSHQAAVLVGRQRVDEAHGASRRVRNRDEIPSARSQLSGY